MNKNSSLSPISWRRIILLLIVVSLAWLPLEDKTIIIPMLLALPVGGLIAWMCFQRFHPSLLLCGLAGGLVVAPITLFWMALKTGIHGHGVADFTTIQMINVIKSAPLWTLAGGLLGWSWQRIRTNKHIHKLKNPQ